MNHDNFGSKIDILTREFETMLDNDKSKSNSEQTVQNMLKKIDEFLFTVEKKGDKESFKEFLKKELDLKN